MISFFLKNFIELELGFSYLLKALVSTISITFVFCDIHVFISDEKLRMKTKTKQFALIGLIYALDYLLIAFLNVLLLWLMNSLFQSIVVPLYFVNYPVYILLLIVQLCIFHKKPLSALIVNASVLDLSLIAISTTCELIAYFICLETDSRFYDFLFSFFYIAFITLVLAMLQLTSISKFNKTEIMYIIAILSSSFLSLFSTLFINPSLSTTTESKGKYLIIYVGIELLTLILYLLYYFTLYEKKKAFDSTAKAYKLKAEATMDVHSKENYQQLLLMKKQVQDQYDRIDKLIEKKDINGLKAVFADVYENNFVPLTFIDCGNATISSIMNIELSKCIRDNISLNHSLIVPSELPFVDYDLCSLFTNIIDNAIDATSALKDKEKKINVIIRYKDPYLIAKITNPTDIKEENLNLVLSTTTKKEKEFHGYGTKIITEIAKKYHGNVKYKINDEGFVVSCMLMKKEDVYAG